MTDEELVVRNIEKLSKERRHFWLDKCAYASICATAIWGGAVLAPASLGFTAVLWGLSALVKKIGYNSSRDYASERTAQIYQQRGQITYDQYKQYHEPPKVVTKIKTIGRQIKSRGRYGFAQPGTNS